MSRFRTTLLVAGALTLGAPFTAALAAENSYDATILVSDLPGVAPNTDGHLVNPWGVAFNPAGFVWVADNGTGFSTLYNGAGVPQSLVVQIPAAPGSEHGVPTGIVFNSFGGFTVTNGTATGSSAFVFATEDGLIAGWAPNVDRTHALQAFPKNGGTQDAVYKGLAIAKNGANAFLYAADFTGGKIDVFDSSFNKVSDATHFLFTDPNLQKDFSPFNVQAINGKLIVTYAKHEEGADDEVDGPSLGIVNEFDLNGVLLRRVVTRGRLNAPWGVALAPATFGAFPNALLIGNFGDGAINAYDYASGEFLGRLRGSNHRELAIDGLWGMAFGNDLNGQSSKTLFFAAGIEDESHGIYGAINPTP